MKRVIKEVFNISQVIQLLNDMFPTYYLPESNVFNIQIIPMENDKFLVIIDYLPTKEV